MCLSIAVSQVPRSCLSEDVQGTSDAKVAGVLKALDPCDVTKLRSFLGFVNYHSKFLPDLATTLLPLMPAEAETVVLGSK